jgi:uncharacterized repeat protein (TIGR01451 family)
MLQVGVIVAGVLLVGPAPGAAAMAAPLTPRHSAQGWVDLIQTGAAVLGCPEGATACLDRSDPSIPTDWVDVDSDPSTVNSSRAGLALPPGAAVNWAGLYWGGVRGDGPADQIRLAIGDSGYTAVAATSIAEMTGGAFQAYADITALLGPVAGSSEPVPVPLTVANVAVARGPGGVGGWAAVVAYSYPNGPDPTYAPKYRTVAVYDGAVAVAAGVPEDLRLERLPTGTEEARLTTALLFQGTGVDLAVAGAPVPRSGDGVTGVAGVPGPGYHLATSPVAGEGVAGDTVTATVSAAGPAYVGTVLGLSRVLPVRVDLSVSTALEPSTLTVGGDAALTVSVRNDSDLRATGVAVALRLPSGVTLTRAVTGYDAGTGVWSVGAVPARGSVDLTLPLRVLAAGRLAATAEISASHLPDPDSSPGDGAPEQDDLAEFALTVASAVPSPTTEAAQAVVPEPSSTPWSRLAPAALFGIGLVALGLLMLLIVVVRGRASR